MTNKRAIIAHIATEVMGWSIELAKTDKPCKVQIYITGPDRQIDWIECANYDPFENHSQAFDALDKFPICQFLRLNGNWFLEIKHNGVWYREENTDLLAAICHAICRATGFEE